MKRTQALGFEKIFLVHTLGLDPTDIIVDAAYKFKSYLDYRYERLNNMVRFI